MMNLQSNTTNVCDLTPEAISKLNVVGYLDEALYAFTLGFLLYNGGWLLVGKGRWRNEQMAIFYAFSLLILVSRLIFLFTWKQQEGRA